MVVLLIILYKMHQIELKTTDIAIGYYIVLLEVMALGFDHIYEAFGNICL